MWLDDSSGYHEGMGNIISRNLQLPSSWGLRAQDLGELIAWGMAAAILLPLAFWAYKGRRSGDGVVIRMVAKPIAALVICAIVLDMVHFAVRSVSWARQVFGVLEDGGEMLAVAFIAAVALAVFRNSHKIYGAFPTRRAT